MSLEGPWQKGEEKSFRRCLESCRAFEKVSPRYARSK